MDHKSDCSTHNEPALPKGGCDCAVPTLHIIPQFCEHAEANIVGNREGLRILRDALSAALDNINPEKHKTSDVYCDDGEGYRVVVERRDIAVGGDLGGPLPYARLVY